MLTHYYRSEVFIKQICSGPAGPFMDGFADSLRVSGYAEITARRHIQAARHFAFWAELHRIPLSEMNNALVERFRRHLPKCRCPFYGFRNRDDIVRGVRIFLAYRNDTDVHYRKSGCQELEITSVHDAFRHWMRLNRNVTDVTLYNYSFVVSELLRIIDEDPSRLSAEILRTFVLERGYQGGNARTTTMVTALRAFVRFLIGTGQCPTGLDAAIPPVAHWHLSSLPKYIQAEEVERTIASCNLDTAVGVRDRAILLLLARLALRAGDIVRMRLDDIDWKDGWIRVCGKERRESRVPLMKEVGKALVEYVRKSRPYSDSDTLFLRSRAPLRGFSSHTAISVIVAGAMRKAGINRPGRGAAHVLRHSAATSMLREGASLQEIATVLRHRSITTTAIYAKVDVSALREIAQPWPVEVKPC